MEQEQPPSRAGTRSLLKRTAALAAFVAIVFYAVHNFPIAAHNLSSLLEISGWRFLLEPQFIFLICGFAFEAFLGLILLGAAFSPRPIPPPVKSTWPTSTSLSCL
jgi:hypothetical protein